MTEEKKPMLMEKYSSFQPYIPKLSEIFNARNLMISHAIEDMAANLTSLETFAKKLEKKIEFLSAGSTESPMWRGEGGLMDVMGNVGAVIAAVQQLQAALKTDLKIGEQALFHINLLNVCLKAASNFSQPIDPASYLAICGFKDIIDTIRKNIPDPVEELHGLKASMIPVRNQLYSLASEYKKEHKEDAEVAHTEFKKP